MLEVADAYLLSLALVLCVLCLGSLIGFVVVREESKRLYRFFILAGAFLIGIAGLEKMGWTARPWSAGSPAQHFNDLLFRIVWLAGFGLIFAGWAAWFRMRRQPATIDSGESREGMPKVVTIRDRPEEVTARMRSRTPLPPVA